MKKADTCLKSLSLCNKVLSYLILYLILSLSLSLSLFSLSLSSLSLSLSICCGRTRMVVADHSFHRTKCVCYHVTYFISHIFILFLPSPPPHPSPPPPPPPTTPLLSLSLSLRPVPRAKLYFADVNNRSKIIRNNYALAKKSKQFRAVCEIVAEGLLSRS